MSRNPAFRHTPDPVNNTVGTAVHVIAELYADQGFEAALKYYRDWLATHEPKADTFHALTGIHLAEKKILEALGFLENHLGRTPADGRILHRVFEFEQEENLTKNDLERLNRILTIYIETRRNRGKQDRDMEKARNLRRKILGRIPKASN